MNPKVSVILPVYNAGSFLREAIQSVLNQSFRDFELILINDGSTDNSEPLILQFSDPRIRYVRNENNIGLIKTLNKGLELAKGEYIARMDQDDISLPSRFEKQVAFLDANPGVAIVATKLVLINEANFEIGHWPEDFNTTTVEEIKQLLPVINCIGHPTVMMRSQPARETAYNEKFENAEDWGLWLSLLSKGLVIAKLNEVLLHYRVHQKSMTALANQQHAGKKVATFKWMYLKNKLALHQFEKPDRLVARSLLKNLLKLFLKPVLGPFLFVLRLPWLALSRQFLSVKRQLETLKGPVELIYIFPYYHTGGAEKVHAAILEAVHPKNTLTFITRSSEDLAFLNKFKAYSQVIEVDQLLKLGMGKRWLMRKITSLFSGSLTVMSSNAQFFYELIPQLQNEVRCIDLVHAFVHLNESGPERWSLPLVSRLNARVVINQKTKQDFDYLYQAHGIAKTYLSRIHYISNFAEPKPFIKQTESGVLKVLYAGRGSAEKRLHLIARAAFELKAKNLPIEFHFAGNVEGYIPVEYLAACILHGNITNEEEMENLYASFNMLIMASSREGFPMVIMEAMMQGVVPISTAVGGIPEHVHPGVTGILIEADKEHEIIRQLVHQFEYVLMHRHELAKLSEQAHRYAVQHFSKENFFNAYLRLLKP